MSAPPGLVWLASFPKSGNTWFRIFLANLAAGDKGPVDINDLDERGSIASSRYEFEAVTQLDSGLLSHEDIEVLRPAVYRQIAGEEDGDRWVKAHDAYVRSTRGEPIFGGPTAARAAIYIVRDPRDVVPSLAHHNNSTIDEAITLMNSPDGTLCQDSKGLNFQLRQQLLGWSGHVLSWLDQTDIPVFLLRYEDLIANPVEGFAAALAFAGRPADPANIARAVAHSEFSELRRQETEQGFGERMSRSAPFFRTGGSGAWRSVLTPEQVRRIEATHAPVMQRLNYELSTAPAEADTP